MIGKKPTQARLKSLMERLDEPDKHILRGDRRGQVSIDIHLTPLPGALPQMGEDYARFLSEKNSIGVEDEMHPILSRLRLSKKNLGYIIKSWWNYE